MDPLDSSPEVDPLSVDPLTGTGVTGLNGTLTTDSSSDNLSQIGGVNGGGQSCTESNKMFIGGLSWNTNETMLYEHFSRFGDIIEHCVMRDSVSHRSRGFGFITYADPESVDRVLSHSGGHIIDDKQVDPKRAVPKYQSKLINKTKKVFLGGLPSDTSNEDVQAHFSKFGEVEEVMLMYDRSTHRLRGFGFVKFVQEEAAEAACREHYHEIKGKMVEAKKAQPKEVMTNMQLRKWSYGLPPPNAADPSLPYFLNGNRTPMFPPTYNTAGAFQSFPYSPVMSNYPGSPTFVTSPLAAAMANEQRGGTPNHFIFSDLMPSPFNSGPPGMHPSHHHRASTMSPSPLDTMTRDSFLSSLGPSFLPGSPRANITSPPLPNGLDLSGSGPMPDYSMMAASPPNTGFQFGSPFFGSVPPAMVAAYQGFNN